MKYLTMFFEENGEPFHRYSFLPQEECIAHAREIASIRYANVVVVGFIPLFSIVIAPDGTQKPVPLNWKPIFSHWYLMD
jgi:hypothetical protein